MRTMPRQRHCRAGRLPSPAAAQLKERVMNPSMVTTALELPGHRITQNLGVVRGITVRSRSALGNLAGGIQALFGGNITIYTELCEKARGEAFELLVRHASEIGADGIVAM